MLHSAASILLVVLGIGFIILIHEWGHFIFCRFFHIKVEVFSIGFGPALWKKNVGGTEYRLAVIPLGGFVKPVGEEYSDLPPQSPDELRARPAYQRLLVFSAGVLMNFLVAFPLCIGVYLLGITREAPVIGVIEPQTAEWNSPLQEGDRLLSIEGTPIQSLKDYLMQISLLPPHQKVSVKILRRGVTQTIQVETQGVGHHAVYPEGTNKIAKVETDSPAWKAGLRPGQRILRLNGKKVFSEEDFDSILEKNVLPSLTLDVEPPPSTGEKDFSFVFKPTKYYTTLPLEDILSARIGTVKTGMPAQQMGLKPGDLITKINGLSTMRWKDLQTALEDLGGKSVHVEIRRDTSPTPIELSGTAFSDPTGHGKLGFAPDDSNTSIVSPPPWTYLDQPLQKGDILIKVNGKDLKSFSSWPALVTQPVLENSPVKPIELTFKRGGKFLLTRVEPVKKPDWDLGLLLEQNTIFIRYPLGRAIDQGIQRTFLLLDLTWLSIRGLFSAQVSPKELMGPIGIFHTSYEVALQGVSSLLLFLALISINLAFVNILPIPVLDGGHVLFLVIEKIRGKPLSERAVALASYTGLALLLLLVIYTVGLDVGRLVHGFTF